MSPSNNGTSGTTPAQGEKRKYDAEETVQRNPHGDFTQVQASRPDWEEERGWRYTKTRDPTWKFGDGAGTAHGKQHANGETTTSNDSATGKGTEKNHVAIDPYGATRSPVQNYKLLISGIVPRPIGFVSTRSLDGTSTNLAPFSYTQVFNHDPPVFGVGFAGGFGSQQKDTLRNLVETGECVINMVSETFVEAANACAIDAPYGVSEWSLSGLTPAACEVVKAPRVKESVFAVECKLMSTTEFESKNPETPGKKTGVLALLEGVRFWVREDALNAQQTLIDPAVMKPVARLGGISYARVLDGYEMLRPVMRKEVEKGNIDEGLLKAKVEMANDE